MPLEMGVWRLDNGRPRRLPSTVLPSEAALEDYLATDPSLLGDPLLVIGRQVRTAHGKYIDLLALDADGAVHVLELKRDRTPRDVVAQTLDYGSWVQSLDRDEIRSIADAHLDRPLEAAFDDTFGISLPDTLNEDHQLTIVATELDPASERIVEYLHGFGIPVNVVFFSYLVDGDREYLARSWLISPDDPHTNTPTPSRTKRAAWNGRDWFVSFGDGGARRHWDDARRYGFIAAGGDTWYSRTLHSLPAGARIFTHIPAQGYVGVGTTTGPAVRFDEATVTVDGIPRRLADLDLQGSYATNPGGVDTDQEADYVVPVEWIATHPREEAFWEKGMFANQNSACKLRQEFTLGRLYARFGIDD